MIRTYIGNVLMSWGRGLGRSDGRELMVKLDEHQIKQRMVTPEQTDRAWDEHLYNHGNVFMKGYANPIKPVVDVDKALDESDSVSVAVADGGEDIPDGTDNLHPVDEGEPAHTAMISSARYQKFMHQNLISQLLTPTEQWRLIAILVGVLGIMMLVNLMVSASAAGVF